MEASHQPYRYGLEFLGRDNRQVAQVALPANWEPALECALFAAQQASPGYGLEGRVTWDVEPVPDPVAGLPYCQGFRVNLEVAGMRAGDRFPLSYFGKTARAFAAGLVDQGRLETGETFHYKLLAWPDSENNIQDDKRPTIEQQLHRLPVRVLAEVSKDGSAETVTGPSQPDDIPVHIPQQVLEEADDLTVKAGAKECGGVLIGHLDQRGGDGGLRVVVTAQIPAEQTESGLTKLVFTPATWAMARNLIRGRGRGEVNLGWWHSHPARYWCSPECPPERRAVCPLVTEFFSAQDHEFHKKMYPKAYSIALVVTHSHEGLSRAVYGWRRALLEERGFHILQPNQKNAS